MEYAENWNQKQKQRKLEHMSVIALSNDNSELFIPGDEGLTESSTGGTSGWKVTKKRGSISGVGVSVSGAGAYAEMSGSMSFSLRQMKSSSAYQKLVSEQKISGGVSGFWGWLGFGANASTYKSQINETFQQMSQSQAVEGTVNVKLMVTGLYPNVQVDAAAYVLVLQITDSQGSNAFTVFSDGAPNQDVGAQDSNGQALPTSGNDSTISIG